MGTTETKFLNLPWREELKAVASSARQSFIVVAPFIKDDAAEWLCGLLQPDVRLLTLAHLNVRAVRTSALDVTALRRLAVASAASRLFSVPNLHAKVFIADDQAAIVTSGNLTSSALDRNREYGVLFHDKEAVQEIQAHILALTSIGSPVDLDVIDRLISVEAELRDAEDELAKSATTAAQQRFNAIVNRAHPMLVGTQVGSRSANAVFGEAIRYVLSNAPLAGAPQKTPAIAREVQRLLPDLCGDDEELVINGHRFGKRWKHRLRNAQQHLLKNGVLAYDSPSKLWWLAPTSEPGQ